MDVSILVWFDSQLVIGKCLTAGKEGDSLPLKHISKASLMGLASCPS